MNTLSALKAKGDFTVRHITSNDGLSLYVRDYPGPKENAKTPILCLGGLTRNSKDFAGLAKYQSRFRRVICPDYRGRGLSAYDPDWRNYDPAKYVEDIRHILCALGVHKIVAIGTSMGGLLSLGLTTAMPCSIKALVLNDVGPRVPSTGLQPIIDYIAEPPHMTTWEEAGQHLKSFFKDQIPIPTDEDWTRAAHASYKELPDGRITFDWDPNIAKPILRDIGLIYDFWHYFDSARRVPILTVRGEKSEILSASQLEEMVEHHPNMDYVVVKGLGHAPSMAEPDALEALNGFLEQH